MKWLFLGILLKITSSLCKMKSKVTIREKNTAHYTHSLYILLTVTEIFNTILFVSSWMIATMIKILFIKYKQSLLITLTKTFPLWIRRSISLTAAVNNIRIAKISLCHQQDFNMDAKWIFSATSHGNSPCGGVGGFVKRYVAKSSSQRPLHDQILSYQSMLDLCGKEIPSITFFGVSQEEMVNVRADQEDRFAKSKTVPGTSSSHHFLPIYCSKIAHTRIKSFFDMISTNHWPKK